MHNTYTAGGQRLESRRTDAQGTVTTMSYEGDEIFENGKLRMLLFDGGYVDFNGYMPYGEEMATLSIPDEVIPEGSEEAGSSTNPGFTLPGVNYSASSPGNWQPFKFSGKESLTRVGLDLYDFGARMYSPSAMRWMTMDPLCEKFYDISPYVYCNGNPIRFVDPDGRTPIYAPVGYAIYEAAKWALLGIAAYFSAETVVEYASNNDYGAGKRWQDQQEGKARDDYNRRRINIQNSINENFPNNTDPNQEPHMNNTSPKLKALLIILRLAHDVKAYFNKLDEKSASRDEKSDKKEFEWKDSSSPSDTSNAKNANNTGSTNSDGTFPVLHPDEKPNNTNQGETKNTR